MSPTADLDPAQVLAALGVTSVASIAPVQGGSDTAIWRVAHGPHSSALRVFRPEQAAVAQRELEAMEVAGAAGIPVPAVRAAGSWRDRPALLLAWSLGQPLFQALRQQPWRVAALGQAFGRTQARSTRSRRAPPGGTCRTTGSTGPATTRACARRLSAGQGRRRSCTSTTTR